MPRVLGSGQVLSDAHRPERNEKSLQTHRRRIRFGEGEFLARDTALAIRMGLLFHLARPSVWAITALEGKGRLGDLPQRTQIALVR
jgi:hypothetical protein